MLVYRFSGEHLVQLRKALRHSTDYFCESCDNCLSCDVEKVCDELYEMYEAYINSAVLCITVEREK